MRCSACVRMICVCGLLLAGVSSGNAQIVISHTYGPDPGQIRHGYPPRIGSYRVHGAPDAGDPSYGVYVPGPIVHQYPGGLHPYDYARIANGLPRQHGLRYSGGITINAPPLVIPYGTAHPGNGIAPPPTFRVPPQPYRPAPQAGFNRSPYQLDVTTNVGPSSQPRTQAAPGAIQGNAADVQPSNGNAEPAIRILQPKPSTGDPDRRGARPAPQTPHAQDGNNTDSATVVDDPAQQSKFPGTRTFEAPGASNSQRPKESHVQPESLKIPLPGPQR